MQFFHSCKTNSRILFPVIFLIGVVIGCIPAINTYAQKNTMKFIKIKNWSALLLMTVIILSAFKAQAQKYKTAADTVKLNKEYAGVQQDITNLKAKLDKANGKTSDYQSKVTSSSQSAATAAQDSKSQAATATNGKLNDVKKEERMAKKASTDANDAKNAQNDEKNNQKDIKKLNAEIEKKQKRLSDLDAMRTSIGSMPAAKADSASH